MTAWVILEDGSKCLFECLECGQRVKDGGVITSLVPFCTSNKKVCVEWYDPWASSRLRRETVELSSALPEAKQRIGVYVENATSLPYASALFTFEGNTRLDLVAAIHEWFAFHMDCAEYTPTIQVYAKRLGIVGRHMIGPVLSASCDAVYVLLR
jgi:hypothetical protein